ncbi:uncharacterized protein LOC132398553 [Hypanus sabinus]|uniref:uncharacterized protein LOC132398553 n=1 Tax=Hypanus sabinus TaxID=79690 RepID=UPI0028C3B613|nr:uncharacterized protein LOC132398553 [Hypanus sabinus]XP_059834162.1 uncharacterized protein LOC132398553 [Hypanus sabinus]XP_059834163.1 uncharacterized protein LOC132398553 [Hypanus sabinus]XP_059834164.1 uncharacterized protein LOC132398553 [Hypanus sabinus]XP_059834165.1 uncharacterized protein LOC132398553 [Hypanus sabinus]XP_059834166.1 uncharacterized protein LOC132398553 [Hypanus sabinus]XP_059834167.1 uncharacterized protein LOC132398553 [Hypanus sabinus]
MEPVLHPERLDLDPQDPDAALAFEHWLACFQSYLEEVRVTEPAVMHRIPLSRVTPKVYSIIRDLPTYDGALDALKRQYLRPVNTVYARHRLATRQQRPGESCAEFLRALQTLVRACGCKTLTAEQHAELLMRDAFVAGLRKSVTGTTLPVWLTSPGPVLFRKHVRSNKYSPLVERVHLLHANPQYAYVVLPDGREDTVSIRDLAPAGAADHYPEGSPVTVNPAPEVTPYSPGPTQTPHDTCIPGVSYAFIPGASHMREGSPAPSGQEQAQPPSPVQSPMSPASMRSQPVLRRSQRQIRPPDRLDL